MLCSPPGDSKRSAKGASNHSCQVGALYALYVNHCHFFLLRKTFSMKSGKTPNSIAYIYRVRVFHPKGISSHFCQGVGNPASEPGKVEMGPVDKASADDEKRKRRRYFPGARARKPLFFCSNFCNVHICSARKLMRNRALR